MKRKKRKLKPCLTEWKIIEYKHLRIIQINIF